MSQWIEQFKRKTYSQRFLWSVVFFFAVATIGGAYLVEASHGRRPPINIDDLQAQFDEQAEDENLSALWKTLDVFKGDEAGEAFLKLFAKVKPQQACDLIDFAIKNPKVPWYPLLAKTLGGDKPVAQELKLYRALWLSLTGEGDEPAPELTAMLTGLSVSPQMHYAAGVFWLSRSMIDKAIDEFVLDVEHEDSESIRHRVIHLCMRYERWDTLARLVRDDEKFRETLGPYQQMHLLAHTGQWWPLFKRLPMHLWGDLDVILIGISLGIGSFWFLFLLKATQPGDRWKQHTGLCLLALFLGVLSVWPTVFCIYFQEDGWGLVEGSDPASVILYYVLGVGLREELCKLLLVLPLVPIIAKPNNGLRMLLIPACVGLGFAIEENMQYYDMSMMADVTGRFVSANVFHFMLTGMAGMELCWFWLYPKQRWQNFLGTFALVVLLHGGYDAVITLTEGDSILGMGSIAILILITYQFFRLLREYRKPQQSGVSQVFVYVMGVCVSAMVVVYYQTWVMGLSEAFNTLADELLFMGIMSVLFLREIPTVLTD